MGIKVLSLFDGLACGMIAMLNNGIIKTDRQTDRQTDRYVAYEIDKYAIQTATHNFPMIEERGDVFAADFTEFEGFDYLIGGSPCTYWSIAQTKNRETVASGMGWELFSQYVRALREAKPKFFLYENNKSMSKEIRESICHEFGFEPVLINSALVSAQNRQRLYWCGIRQADGTYKRADVTQPDDRGILLKDILETRSMAMSDKAHALLASQARTTEREYFTHHQGSMAADPVPEPKCVASRGRNPEDPTDRTPGIHLEQMLDHHGYHEMSELHPRPDGKTNTLSTVLKDNMIAEPIKYNYCDEKTYTDIEPGECVDMSMPNSKTRRGRNMKTKTKTNVLQTSCQFFQYCGTVNVPIYEVKDGKITVKGKQYPIKLVDGYYIIRKLTVRECMRLQTVPEWYEFPVSNSQAYKLLGNGWTCEVISHILRFLKED